MENTNWKCQECGHVCGTEGGIRSHYGLNKKKGNGHGGKVLMEQTSEPKLNSGGWNKRGKKKKKKGKYNDVKMEQLMENAIREEREEMAAMLIITPLIIKGTQVIQSVDVRIIQEGELIC